MQKKNKTSFSLVKEIINSDFSILKLKNVKATTAHTQSRLKLSANTFFDALNLFVLHRSLKQFIRNLQFISKRPDFASIIFFTNNIFLKTLILKIFKKNLKTKISVEHSIKNIKKLQSWERQLIILLDVKFVPFIHKFMSQETYLIHKINQVAEKKQLGTYKIFNNLNELKKIIFFFILMRKILLKAEKVKKWGK